MSIRSDLGTAEDHNITSRVRRYRIINLRPAGTEFKRASCTHDSNRSATGTCGKIHK